MLALLVPGVGMGAGGASAALVVGVPVLEAGYLDVPGLELGGIDVPGLERGYLDVPGLEAGMMENN
jgi:hypothetical protein